MCVNYLSKGLDKGGFYHENFLRGKRFLTRRIVRIDKKGKKGKKTKSSRIPAFYTLPFLSESEPKNHRQATVQSAGWVQPRDESTAWNALLACRIRSNHSSRCLHLPRNMLCGSFETQERRPIQTAAHAKLWDGVFRTRQLEPPMNRFAASTQPSNILKIPRPVTLEDRRRESSAVNRTRMSPLEVFTLQQQLSTPK
jgi:hypothetical protein